MTLQLTIPYETLLSLVDQLSPEQRHQLEIYLLNKETPGIKTLTPAEKIERFQALVVDWGPVNPEYSDRREDWYGDEGR